MNLVGAPTIGLGGSATVVAAGDHVVKVARPGAGPREALAREARALARLGAPLTPSLHGHATLDDRDALVLERLAGVTLAARLAAGLDHVARRQLGALLVDAMAAVHARGVVHGDLSTGNIMCLDDGGLRLIDFGSAVIDDEVAPAAAATTPAYAAPERVRGVAPADRASDVYALGAILFELVTGRVPFEGSATTMLLDHARRRAPRASSLVPLARPLDDLLAACLEKDPRRRPDAVSVATAWHAAAMWTDDVTRRVGSPASSGRASRSAPAGAPPASTPASSPSTPASSPSTPALPAAFVAPAFVGRSAELALAVRTLGAALAGVPTVISITGDAGYGKSRLLAELSARRPDLIVFDAGATDGVRRLLERLGAADVEALLAAAAPEDVDALRLVANLGGVATGWRTRAPGALRHAATRALAHALGAAAPLALAVDDAHRADPLLLDALELAALAERGRPLWIAVVGRPELRRQRPQLGGRAAACEAIELAPISRDQGRQLAESMLPDRLSISHAILDRIVSQAAGVPLVIGELTRSLCASGNLRREEGGGLALLGAFELAAPSVLQVHRLVAAELGRLPASLRVHAWAHALLVDDGGAHAGDVVDAVAAAAAWLPLDHAAACRSLAAAGLLVPAVDGRLGFRHGVVRDAVAAQAPAPLRADVHLSAYRALRAQRADPTSIARHAEGGGLIAEAAQAWLEAARGLAERHDYLGAEAAADRAAACVDADRAAACASADVGAAALRIRARMRSRLGRHADAGRDFATLRRDAAARGDTAAELDALLDEATERDWLRADAEVHALVEEALAFQVPGDDLLLRARRDMAAGRDAWRRGELPRAASLLERVVGAALGEEAYETVMATRLMLGFILPSLGQADRGADLLVAARDHARARGDRLHEAAALNNWMAVTLVRGDVDVLLAGLREVVAIGRELGHLVVECRARVNLALFLARVGRDDDAAVVLTRAVEIERALPRMYAAPRATVALARLAARRGELPRAAELLDRVADHLALSGGALSGFDAALQRASELAVRSVDDDAAWLALADEVARDDKPAALEVLELRASDLRRRARRAEATRVIERGLAHADVLPGFFVTRLHRALEAA